MKKNVPVHSKELEERLRKKFAVEMPEVRFSFEPSDIVSQVMSLGALTPIEVDISGPNFAADREFAEKVKEKLQTVTALRDIHFGQLLDYPTVDVRVDRERAGMIGAKMDEISRSLIPATWSSRFVRRIYWADPKSDVSYQVQVQIPQQDMTSVEAVQNVPIHYRAGKKVLLRDLAKVTEGTAVEQYAHYNNQRMITVAANIAGVDLGGVSRQVGRAIKELGAPPAKVNVAVRGQVIPMQQMIGGLQTGLGLAVLVIFLLLAANFQSLKLSLIVISATPAVITGVLLALWLTGTTLNIQSFIGAIMAIGVGVANAILLVTFAERARVGHGSGPGDALTPLAAADAAVVGAGSRLRPILMTSLAMIAGMIPMALGLAEGGQEVVPLGRAVVGGLAVATVGTLLVLPSVFAIVQARSHRRSASLNPDDPGSQLYCPADAGPPKSSETV